MKKLITTLALVAALAGLAMAAPYMQAPPVPKVLANGRFVYVRAYDGDQFNPNLLPEDRQAIASVQDALQKWGHYIVVYRAREADVILVVQSRPTEDVLAAYDPKFPDAYLWRVMGEGGLQAGETPLMTQFEQAVEKAGK
jgi:hypothetical protein